MTTADVKIDESEFRRASQLLKTVDDKIRREGLMEAFTKASEIVVASAKREVPQPGYPGDKSGKKPLRETIGFVIRDYSSGTMVAVIGPQYPAGAHGHLVHDGHEIWLPKPAHTEGADAVRTGRRTEADPFLERAGDNTAGEQQRVIVSTLQAKAAGIRG